MDEKAELLRFQAEITFRNGSTMKVPLVFENEEQARKEITNYNNYVRTWLSHDEPFTLYFGGLILRGGDIIAFSIRKVEPEKPRVIGFSTKE